MTTEPFLRGKRIAVSISESPDLPQLGLSLRHLRDVWAEVARHLLADGARLLYGGDLRTQGFSRVLFELVARYHRDSSEDPPPVVNLLAWPVHATLPFSELEQVQTDLGDAANLVYLTRDGSVIPHEERRQMVPCQASQLEASDWAVGLTSMRRLMTERSDARVLLGGRVEGYHGTMPGIAEEALLAVRKGQPVFIAGGFGGCARDIAETMRIDRPRYAWNSRSWPQREHFARYSAPSLRNGLSDEENGRIASSTHADEIALLVRRGLWRLGHQGGSRPASAS